MNREVCSLRDVATDFAKLGVTVYGISFDNVALQAKFAEREKLNFQLLSDPDQVAGKLYGATRIGGVPFPKRVTFVIDPTGILRHVSEKVNVRSHGADLVKIIDGLRTASPSAPFGKQVSASGIKHSFLITGSKTAILGEDNSIIWQVPGRSRDGSCSPTATSSCPWRTRPASTPAKVRWCFATS